VEISLLQVLGAFLIFIFGPILGMVPPLTRYEAIEAIVKGLLIAGLTKYFFPVEGEWIWIALAAFVCGRYARQRRTSLYTLVAGLAIADPRVAGFALIIGGISSTIFRQQKSAWILLLGLLPLMSLLFQPKNGAFFMTAAMTCGLVYWVDQKLPPDRSLNTAQIKQRGLLHLFRTERGVASLDRPLRAERVGLGLATLAILKQAGFPVRAGWIVYPGDDPEAIAQLVEPAKQTPAVVKAIAIATGTTMVELEATTVEQLWGAIVQAFESARVPVVLLIQSKIWAVTAGVGLPGDAGQVWVNVLSNDRVTSTYHVQVPIGAELSLEFSDNEAIRGSGELPPKMVWEIACFTLRSQSLLKRSIQLEWAHDGEQLWITGANV
ncbi:MAG: hypothetical protein VKJ24_05560, partial [Synechococcales bacterium]|nr:hypothetical protein [Synechococcales bacterium]